MESSKMGSWLPCFTWPFQNKYLLSFAKVSKNTQNDLKRLPCTPFFLHLVSVWGQIFSPIPKPTQWLVADWRQRQSWEHSCLVLGQALRDSQNAKQCHASHFSHVGKYAYFHTEVLFTLTYDGFSIAIF